MASAKREAPSESSSNEIWREMIRREDNALRNQKKVYSCNLNAIRKDQITAAPGTRTHDTKPLTEEEEATATKILEDYGIKTREEEPSKIIIPYTTNAQFGNYLHYTFPDERRSINVKTGCAETKYAENFYNMTGKNAFAKKS